MRFSRKYHDSVPWGASSVGKDAFSWVRSLEFNGESLSSPRSSSPVSVGGIVAEVGPRKMVFSTLAETEDQRADRSRRDHGRCMVYTCSKYAESTPRCRQ